MRAKALLPPHCRVESRESSSTAGAIGSSSYAYGGGGSSGSGSDGVPAGAPPRWVAAALLPTVLWCITW